MPDFHIKISQHLGSILVNSRNQETKKLQVKFQPLVGTSPHEPMRSYDSELVEVVIYKGVITRTTAIPNMY